LLGEVEEQPVHPGAVIGGLIVDRPWWRLGSSADERAAAEIRIGERQPLHLEDADQPVTRRSETRFEFGGHPLASGGVPTLQVSPDEPFCAAEGTVKCRLGHPGVRENAVDSHRVDALVAPFSPYP
jgi:hypothetical protein